MFFFSLKEFWSSNCHTDDNYFQYCVFKDRPIHDFQTYISSSTGYINLLLGVFDRFSHCLHEVTRIVFTNMVFLVQIQFVDNRRYLVFPIKYRECVTIRISVRVCPVDTMLWKKVYICIKKMVHICFFLLLKWAGYF